MVKLDNVTEGVLDVINDNKFSQTGAFNLRENGTSICHGDSEHIKIKKKTDKPGIDIYIDGKTVRETNVELGKDAKLYVTERLMTDGEQKAESNIEVQLNGEDSSAQIVSRSVGKGNSVQTFHPNAIGNSKCQAHIQCDSIIMDHAEVGSIPEIRAKNIDAAIIHEAAIGRINDEQLLKLRTLGLTEEEAEEVIIQNFLN